VTAAEFRQKFGADFRRASGKPWFEAFMSVLRDESPATKSPDVTDINVRLNGSIAKFNEIIGYETIMRLIGSLKDEPKEPFDPKSTFSEPEEI